MLGRKYDVNLLIHDRVVLIATTQRLFNEVDALKSRNVLLEEQKRCLLADAKDKAPRSRTGRPPPAPSSETGPTPPPGAEADPTEDTISHDIRAATARTRSLSREGHNLKSQLAKQAGHIKKLEACLTKTRDQLQASNAARNALEKSTREMRRSGTLPDTRPGRGLISAFNLPPHRRAQSAPMSPRGDSLSRFTFPAAVPGRQAVVRILSPVEAGDVEVNMQADPSEAPPVISNVRVPDDAPSISPIEDHHALRPPFNPLGSPWADPPAPWHPTEMWHR
jgi:hypothetical protein